MKKYVACILTKHDLGNNNYIFSTSHIVTGFYNGETKEFVDRNGNHFYNVISPQVLNLSISKGFFNCIEINKLKRKLKMSNCSTEEVLKKYSIICSKLFYYVGKNSDGRYFINESSIEEIKREVGKQTKNTKEDQMPDKEKKLKTHFEDLIDYLAATDLSLESLFELRNNMISSFTEFDKSLYAVDSLIVSKEKGIPLSSITDEDVFSFRSKKSFQVPSFTESISLDENQDNKAKDDEDIKVKEEEIEKDSNEEKEDTIRYQKLMGQDKINIEETFRKVTRSLVGQDKPARDVIIEVVRSLNNTIKKGTALLLTGDTGVGKTYMMELIAEALDRPFAIVDSTTITVAGYVGTNLDEVVWNIYEACGRDKAKAERAIVFFDEIDKKGSKDKSDISGQGVLNSLLKFIDGTTYTAKKDAKRPQESVEISTKNMIIVFGGAFTDVYRNLEQDNSIGFSGDISSKDQPREATVNDFVEKAMMPREFMGRVEIIHLNDLTVEDIKKIFEADNSASENEKKVFEKYGVKLTFTDEYIQRVAEEAYKQGTGARSLKKKIKEDTREAYADAYSHEGEYSEIIIDENTAQDNHQYQKIKKFEPTTNE